jgi:hypothetical protein
MKIRTGFVSNSSSSSFIVAFKGNLDEVLEKAFHVEISMYHPLCHVITDMVETIKASVYKEDIYNSLEEYLKELECEDVGNLGYHEKEIAALLQKGYKVGSGGFEDDYEGSITSYLCNQDFDFESDDLVFKQDGGY